MDVKLGITPGTLLKVLDQTPSSTSSTPSKSARKPWLSTPSPAYRVCRCLVNSPPVPLSFFFFFFSFSLSLSLFCFLSLSFFTAKIRKRETRHPQLVFYFGYALHSLACSSKIYWCNLSTTLVVRIAHSLSLPSRQQSSHPGEGKV